MFASTQDKLEQSGSWSPAAVNVLESGLQVMTWNIAAVNNNPFEYWITMPGTPEYASLMSSVEEFIENPDRRDIIV